MLSSSRWFTSGKNVFRLVLYTTTACLISVTLWVTLTSDIQETVTITLTSNNDVVKAVYKCAFQNVDGTVDLVFNVPNGGQSLLQMNDRHVNSSTTTEAYPDVQPTRQTASPPQVRSRYPVTLEASYVINAPNLCPAGQPVDYIIMVHSATAYFERRRAIRETFGGQKLFGHITQRVVFLLGLTTDPVTTRSIQEEAFINRDIVQGQFTDSYHNLTHKGVLGLRWVSEHCHQAKLVIKIDDDVFVNPFKLVLDILPVYTNKTRHIACHLRRSGTSPIVRGKSKWQVQEDEFKGHHHYPFDYCNGYFVIISGDLIRPMLTAARLSPFFWVDDVYLFGILPATVGATSFVDIKKLLTLKFDYGKKCYQEKGSRCRYLAVSQWRAEDSEKFWYMVLSSLTTSVRNQLHVFGLS